MIISNDNKELTSNLSKDNGVNFTINASAHAFQILSSGIYEHKIAAVVRELCTNAFDSHVEASIPETPFSVILPTEMHPYFEVEDFGVGMSIDDAFDVYTVYFSSTKGATNEVAGGLGLGSKTPFAYTKQFNVRIRKDGVEHLAMIYVDASGAPRMDVIYTQDTEESNGVKVSVPVDSKDFQRFHYEAQFFLSFYPVTPTFNKEVQLNFPEVSNRLTDGGHAYVPVNSTAYSNLADGRFYAVMGPVPYSVNVTSMIDDKTTVDILKRSASNNGCLFVKFEIGELSVSASRESLSMDERTVAAIKERFTEVAKSTKKRIFQLGNDESVHPIVAFRNFVAEFGGDFYTPLLPNTAHLHKVRREFTIPKMGFCTLRHGRRSSGSYCSVRKVRMDSFGYTATNDEGRNKIKVLVIDCNKKLIKDLFLSVNSNVVYNSPDTGLSEIRKKRLEDLFFVEMEVTNYSDLYASHLAKKKAERAARTVGGVVRTKHPDTSIIASGVYNATSGTYGFVNERVDICENTYYIDPVGTYSFRCVVDGNDLYPNNDELRDMVGVLSEYFDIPHLMVVRRNTRNMTRLTKHETPSLEVLIQKFIDETKDSLEAPVKSAAAKKAVGRIMGGSHFRDFRKLWFYKAKQTPSEVMTSLDELLSTPIVAGSSSYEVFYNFYKKTETIEEYVEDIDKHFDIIYDFAREDDQKLITEAYPLLDSQYASFAPTQEVLHCLKYVEMVDSIEPLHINEVVDDDDEENENENEEFLDEYQAV